MAIRYSGNVQVNMQYDQPRGLVLARVRDPAYKWRGTTGTRGAPTTETYDRIAKAAIARAERDLSEEHDQRVKLDAERDKSGRVLLRRVFQAPCPSGKWEEF